MLETASPPSGTTQVLLTSNVTVDGVDYGPDYGSALTSLPTEWARTFVKRGTARVPWLGPCDRDSQRCDTATLPETETTRCCIEAALETLRRFQELCDAHDVTWWIDYGTLLGAAVDGSFYWNDKDCDVGVLAEDQDTVLRMGEAFQRTGFTFAYVPRGLGEFGGGDRLKVRWSESHHANTDVFFWHRRGDMLHRRQYVGIDRYKGREFPAAWLDPMVMIPFEDLEVPAPAKYEQLVAHRYGANWRDLPAAQHDGVQR